MGVSLPSCFPLLEHLFVWGGRENSWTNQAIQSGIRPLVPALDGSGIPSFGVPPLSCPSHPHKAINSSKPAENKVGGSGYWRNSPGRQKNMHLQKQKGEKTQLGKDLARS